MTKLDLARKIFRSEPWGEETSYGPSSYDEQQQATVSYGTVMFAGDGETPYTYTASDGTQITVTLAPDEYAVLLDSGETIIVTSMIPLEVGDRVTLTWADGAWALTANQSTAKHIGKTAEELQRDYVERISAEGDAVRREAEAGTAVVQSSLDDFKKTHQLTDDDITKTVSETKSQTTTEYQAAISAYDKEVTARYQAAIGDSEESTRQAYTDAISSASSDADAKIAAAQAAADDARSSADKAQEAADGAQSAADANAGEIERVRTNVETNYLLKATYTEGIQGLEDKWAETYVSKADQDTLNADFDARIKANAEGITSEASSRKSAISNLDTAARGYADTAQGNAEKTAKGYADTAQSNATDAAREYTDGQVAAQNEKIGTITESQSALSQRADGIESDVSSKWTTIQRDYLTGEQAATQYASKTSVEQTATGLQVQIDSTLSDVRIEYATSESPTTAPTSGWSTDSPTWSEGTYVWQRTTTYATSRNDDGTTSKRELSQTTTCIQGARGEDGAPGGKGDPGDPGRDGIDGNDGRGVRSIVSQYTRSSSGSTNSAYGGWSASCPTYDASYPYYWARQLVTYTDGTTAYAPSSTGALDQGLTDANRNASAAKSDAAAARAVTTRFRFDDTGMQVRTDADEYVTCSTYTSDGVASMDEVYELRIPKGVMGVKNWGWYFGCNSNYTGSDYTADTSSTVQMYATEGTVTGHNEGAPSTNPCFFVKIPGLLKNDAGNYIESLNPQYVRLDANGLVVQFGGYHGDPDDTTDRRRLYVGSDGIMWGACREGVDSAWITSRTYRAAWGTTGWPRGIY